MKNEFLLCNARVVDPQNLLDEIQNLAIKDGVFVEENELSPAAEKIDLSGKLITNGFFDLHVHLREPGQCSKEDISSGTKAAAAGGFTGLLAMPNTAPPIDSAERFLDVQKTIKEKAIIQVIQSAAFTLDRKGEELSDLQALKDAGVIALTDDGGTPQSEEIMLQAMKKAAQLNLPIIDHCENMSLSASGVMHEGAVSEKLGFKGQPRAAEEDIVRRNIELCRKTSCRVHLQHLSSAGSVEMLRAARKEGLNISGEVCPHHLYFTDKAIEEFGANAKMAPPLREESDRLALLEAVCDGTITVLATDHAPHTKEEKEAGIIAAPFGITGLEAAIPICLTLLYHTGKMSLYDFINCFTAAPREVIGLKNPAIKIGEAAELTILDLNIEHKIDINESFSKSRNCPYQGIKCKGKAIAVFYQGKYLNFIL